MAETPLSKITMLGVSVRLACYAATAFGACLAGGCNRSDSSADTAATKFEYNRRISFGSAGNSDQLKVSGWSKAEEKFAWSTGTSARLQFSLPATNDPVVLKMRMAALVKPPELPIQPVEVFANNAKLAEWQVADVGEFVAPLPRDITKSGGNLTIEIKTPKATSPKALGLSVDPRVLGICCLDLELSKG